MDTQGSGYVDPADQWVLDPVTGTYQLRLEPAESPDPSAPGPVPPGPVPPGPAGAPAPQPGPAPESGTRAGTRPDPAPVSASSSVPAPSVPRPPGSRRAPSGRAARRAAGVGHGNGGHGGGTGSSGPPSRRKPKERKSKALLWTAGTIGLAVVAGGLGGYLAFHRTGTVIHAVDVGNAGSAAFSSTGAMNLLVLGTDSRAGLGHEAGDASATGQADTAVLLHLSADRSNATAVSIPPDLITDIPECPVGNQVVKGATGQQFSTVLAGRDPGCAMRLVTQITGVRVDHFLMVDFAAVQKLSTALGGVEMCLKEPLHDKAAGLSLDAGRQRIEGEQALALVRAKQALPGTSGVPAGSDLARVEVQEQFLAGLFRTAASGATLTDPKKLTALATTAASVLTVDTPIGSVGTLDDLARELGKVDQKHFTFAELPVKDNPADSTHHTVVLDQAKSTQLFGLVKQDISLSRGPVAPDPKLVGSRTTPHNTRVTVHNGTGTFGASQDVLQWLQVNEGVNRSANGGDAAKRYPKTILDYAPNQADQARELAALMGLPASALVEGTKDVPRLTYMSLTLGADYTQPGTPIAPPTTPPAGLRSITADSTTCVG
ncbi:transcriptional attenuator, LytR family [Actinacidiphila yanglinensis]|uniref:Transcriptional attenuator, LytR family n=1 Tax=Actinacidiphila yanglinensis TaxID=310779 RepID=A0A1H6EAG1_9ACTN|nr:LCP family protein [Actinacidiphila yanglinensis]SEG93805.1 transcriptional attenuator, LytR family [Actinacidiphila yanglinensis]